jgi:glyoxylase-like metal-dependent hydrolase (beta-lactamase superfamily II)
MDTMNQKARPVVRGYGGGPFGQNGYVVSCSGGPEAILIDPGSTTSEMLRAAKREGLKVAAIVLTHAHIDHVEGVAEAKRETGAPILLHRDDALMYRQIAVQAQMFGVRLEMPPPVDDYLTEGTSVEFGSCELEVRHTPGHAPGHVILVGEGFALVGDCVFAGSIGRTDLPGGDFQTLMASIRGQILTLPDETILYTGHGQDTTVGHERVANPFLVPQFGGSRFA